MSSPPVNTLLACKLLLASLLILFESNSSCYQKGSLVRCQGKNDTNLFGPSPSPGKLANEGLYKSPTKKYISKHLKILLVSITQRGTTQDIVWHFKCIQYQNIMILRVTLTFERYLSYVWSVARMHSFPTKKKVQGEMRTLIRGPVILWEKKSKQPTTSSFM